MGLGLGLGLVLIGLGSLGLMNTQVQPVKLLSEGGRTLAVVQHPFCKHYYTILATIGATDHAQSFFSCFTAKELL